MENVDVFSVEVKVSLEKLPEGDFYVAVVDLGEDCVAAMARSKPIAVALAFEKLATEIKKKHYESKGVPYGAG